MLYILFYEIGAAEGNREEWNTFYTPFVIFLSSIERDKAKLKIQSSYPNAEFHEIEQGIETVEKMEF